MRRAGIAALVVAGALVAPAGAAADWTPGEYRGSTSQGREARMGFSERDVFRHGFEVNVTCTKKRRGRRPARRREGGRYTSGRPIGLGSDGRFSAKRKSGRFKTSFSGQVEGQEATGKFGLTFKEAGGWTCRSPTIRWSVSRIN